MIVFDQEETKRQDPKNINTTKFFKQFFFHAALSSKLFFFILNSATNPSYALTGNLSLYYDEVVASGSVSRMSLNNLKKYPFKASIDLKKDLFRRLLNFNKTKKAPGDADALF